MSVRSPEYIANRVHVTQDAYSRVALYRGPTIHTKSFFRRNLPWSDNQGAWMHMRVVGSPEHGIDRQLVLELDDHTAYYGTAYDHFGRRLNVNQLDRMADCLDGQCTTSERVVVSFPQGYLESHVLAGRGLDLKLYGRYGRTVIKVPANYVAGFVQAVGYVGKQGESAPRTSDFAIQAPAHRH
jgi:hypothetical protein